MTKFLLYFILLLQSVYCYAKCGDKPVIVAVIDTGFGYEGHGHEAKLCKFGHKDFTPEQKYANDYNTNTPIPLDKHGHGTNVVGIIEKFAKKGLTNYCIVVIKYYSDSYFSNNLSADIKAFNYATSIKADFINFSSGGKGFSEDEKEAVINYLDNGGKLVCAAGNNGVELGMNGHTYYPALYDARIVVVGSLNEFGERVKSSNYGKPVNRWEIGTHVEGYGIDMSGTSQATATATGKLLSENSNKCDIGDK